MAQTELNHRGILAGLRISAWSARKYDRKISQEVADSHGATIEAGRYNKHLMPADAASYKALNQFISATRDLHYKQTLPWTDDGWRLLPMANYNEYTDKLRRAKHEFDRLLSEFVNDYPALREQARIKLNGMFSEEDYPRIIARRYSFGFDFNPVPTGNHFDTRLGLSKREIESISADVEERTRQAFEDAQRDAVKRLYECVAKIHERLTATTAGEDGEMKPGVFRDSLIGNARELCDVLQRLNIADDPKLEDLRKQTAKLAKVEPQELREVADVRKDTAKKAAGILAAFTATYGNNIIV